MKNILNTSQQFIDKARLKHGDTYEYSKVNYTGSKNKVDIICRKHGLFSQNASSHLSGAGCQKCGKEKSVNKRRKWRVENFKAECQKIHPDLIFDKTIYTTPNSKVEYECKKHGTSYSLPRHLINGHGCKKCSLKGVYSNYIDIIRECDIVHNKFYQYSKINPKLTLEQKQTIICPIHGDFQQRMSHHKRGSGCPKCAVDKISQINKENPSGWTYTNWKTAGLNSSNFEGFKLYLIKCWNEDEEFYKIGRTFVKMEKRFETLPYNYEIIDVIKGDAIFICKTEEKLKHINKHNKYIPTNNFNGENECFTEKIDINV